jgi:hypothetical protein
MKTKKVAILILPVSCAILALVAWSPPNEENLLVGPVTGTTANSIASPNGQAAVIGSANKMRGTYSLTIGSGNENYTPTDSVHENRQSNSLVVGYNNMAAGDRSNCIISGSTNKVDANATLVSGYNNDVQSVASIETRNSGIIGGNNIVTSPHAYAMGYTNTVSGDYGHAYGTGLKATQSCSVAVGKYNASMVSGDVFAVGTGTSDTSRTTALRATSDGSVILGSAASGKVILAKAQGDISMGQYSN